MSAQYEYVFQKSLDSLISLKELMMRSLQNLNGYLSQPKASKQTSQLSQPSLQIQGDLMEIYSALGQIFTLKEKAVAEENEQIKKNVINPNNSLSAISQKLEIPFFLNEQSQTILEPSFSNQLIPFDQGLSVLDDLKEFYQNLKSIFKLKSRHLSINEVEEKSTKELKEFYLTLDRVLKQNQIIQKSTNFGHQGDQNERIREILTLCSKVQQQLLKDDRKKPSIRQIFQSVLFQESISMTSAGLKEILHEYLETFQKQISELKSNITGQYQEEINKLNEQLEEKVIEITLDDQETREKLKQIKNITNQLLKRKGKRGKSSDIQQSTRLEEFQSSIQLKNEKETPGSQIELVDSLIETNGNSFDIPSGLDKIIAFNQSERTYILKDQFQPNLISKNKRIHINEREFRGSFEIQNVHSAADNKGPQIIFTRDQFAQFMKILTNSAWLSSFNNTLLNDNTSIFIGPARNSSKQFQAISNTEVDEGDTPSENENSKSFITLGNATQNLQDGQESNVLTNLPSENQQEGDFDIQPQKTESDQVKPQVEEQQVEVKIVPDPDVQKNLIFNLNTQHLKEIEKQGKIKAVIEFIQYLSNMYKTVGLIEQLKGLQIRDILKQNQDGQLKLLWQNFKETWNAQTPTPDGTTADQTFQSPIFFDDDALLSYFISIDEEAQFVSIEKALELIDFLSGSTPLKQQNNLKHGDEDNYSNQQLKQIEEESKNSQHPIASETIDTSTTAVDSTTVTHTNASKRKRRERDLVLSLSKTHLTPEIEWLEIPNQNAYLVDIRVLKNATIESDNVFALFNFLNILEIDNSKVRTRKITTLRELNNTNIPHADLKSYMKEFKQYAQDVLFGENKERRLHQIQVEWSPFSDEFLISLVLALSDKMPSKIYGEAIAVEINRLESVGESIMEHAYIVSSVTNPTHLGLHFNDLENLRIQTLKVSNLHDLARQFYLDYKLLTNLLQPSDAPKRELSAIVNSVVGALGLWAGMEPVYHFLQLLGVNHKDKKKRQEVGGVSQIMQAYKVRKEQMDEEVKEDGGSLSKSVDKNKEEEASMFEEEKGEESQQNFEDFFLENATPEEEKEGKYYHSNQDYLIIEQLYQYNTKLSSSIEIKKIMDSVPQIIDMEKKLAMIINSNESIELKQNQKVIFKLALFDSSFNDSRFMETEIGKTNEFLRGNLSNLKLKMIGQSFISMLFKVRMYYETADTTTELQYKSAQHIEAEISQIMLASWHCYGITTKFTQISSVKGNLIPIVTSDNNQQLITKINEYEKPIRPTYIIPATELAAINEFSNASTKASSEQILNSNSTASTQHSTNYSLKTYTYNSKDYSRLYQDGKKDKPYRQFFTSKPSDKMQEIAENFIPEYGNILQALIGAKFIQSMGKLKETSELAQFLLMHNRDYRFPIFKEMKTFYSNLWNANPFSKILKLHYSVEHIKGPEKMLYYKVYIQTLEIRRVKFKASHSSRHQRIFKDVYQYIEVGNKVFQEYQKINKFPLSPYEYITFHQEYRKIYKVGASFESLFKLMEPFYSKRKKAENNPLSRVQKFLGNIKRMTQEKKGEKEEKFTLTKKIVELLANQIEADLKKDNCKAIDNVLTGQKDLQIMEYLDLSITQLLQQEQSQTPTEDQQEQQKEQTYQEIMQKLSEELDITLCSHGHLFNDEESLSSMKTETFSSKDLFSAKSSNEDVLRLFEHLSEQYIQ